MTGHEILLLIASILAVILVIMVHNSFKISPSSDDYSDIKTGGPIEARYLEMGEYNVASLKVNTPNEASKYSIYFPEDIFHSDETFPVIIYSNGTLVKGTDFPLVMKRLSSWGFIVMATEEEFSHSGTASEMCLELILRLNDSKKIAGISSNPFYKKVDTDNIGITGHSQGGAAVFNAFNDFQYSSKIKAIFAASPVSMSLSHKLGWDYDPSIITVPTFLVSCLGRGDERIVVNEEELLEIYNLLPDSIFKVMARRVDADHGDMLNRADGYMTAWFRWILRDDKEAAKAFIGETPEILDNPLYKNARVRNPDSFSS